MTDNPEIDARNLSKYPRPVRSVVAEAVNKHGVGHRIMDGTHIRLYTGDRDVTPFKVAAVRPAEETLRLLIPWLEKHVPSWTEGPVEKERLEALAEVVSTQPVPKPETAKVEVSKWKPYKYNFETDGETYRCMFAGCKFTATSHAGCNMHHASHTGEKKKQAAKAVATAAIRREQKKVIATQALAALAELHGLRIGDVDTKGLERENARLKKENETLVKNSQKLAEQVESLKQERDEAKARVELMREALRA